MCYRSVIRVVLLLVSKDRMEVVELGGVGQAGVAIVGEGGGVVGSPEVFVAVVFCGVFGDAEVGREFEPDESAVGGARGEEVGGGGGGGGEGRGESDAGEGGVGDVLGADGDFLADGEVVDVDVAGVGGGGADGGGLDAPLGVDDGLAHVHVEEHGGGWRVVAVVCHVVCAIFLPEGEGAVEGGGHDVAGVEWVGLDGVDRGGVVLVPGAVDGHVSLEGAVGDDGW